MTGPHSLDAHLALERLLWAVYDARVPTARLMLALERMPGLSALTRQSPALACALGDDDALRALLDADPALAQRPLPPLGMPPLVAVTHSGFLRVPDRREALHRSVRLLLKRGADARAAWCNAREPDAPPLSALYGAAGKHGDATLTELLLTHGAGPDDGESLYHSITRADLTCARLLLDHGARIDGTNALFHVLDVDHLDGLCLLLKRGADPNESGPQGLRPLHWAIRRRRSPAHLDALLDAGADPEGTSASGKSAIAYAARYGVTDSRARLATHAALSPADALLAACARGDVARAENVIAAHAGLLASLTDEDLGMLPEHAAAGHDAAVRVMVGLGWPIAARGGDWSASALNHAVFRGNADLAGFLLDHGAHWSERHGYNDTVVGTLSFASVEQPADGGDWVGCARTLTAHGMPVPSTPYGFSAEVEAYFATLRAPG